MGNLCSIFHSRFKNLIRVIPSARKAQLLDYILLGWQTSTYKLKGSDKKWFMKPYSEIVHDTGIPKSTLERYIKELSEAGFIERRQALYSRKKEQGEFEVKKGAYINITDRLISLLEPAKNSPESLSAAQDTDIHNDNNKSSNETSSNMYNESPDGSNLEKNEGIDHLKMRGLYISDLYSSLSNNITSKKSTNSVDKTTLNRLTHQFQSIQTFLFSEIKEEIPETIKKLALGTFFNLLFEHHKEISSPEQLVSEYLYALLNVDFYLPNVTCFKHRNNILSKVIRSNSWRTPKGFYKHFYLGQNFKDKQEIREKQWQIQKNEEINAQKLDINDVIKDKRLTEIETQIFEKGALIENLTESLYQQSSEEAILNIRNTIKALKSELEGLWHQQLLIEQKIENQNVFSKTRLCA